MGKRKCRLLLWSVRPPWKGPAGTWINVKIFIGNSFDEYHACGWPVKYFFEVFGSPVEYSRDLPPLLADYLFPLLLFVPEAKDHVMSSLKNLKMVFWMYLNLAAWCFLRFTLKQYLTFFQDKDIIDNNLIWFLNNILLRPNEPSEIVRSFQPWAFEEIFYISMISFHLSSIMAVLRSFHGLLSSTFASFVSSTFLDTWQYLGKHLHLRKLREKILFLGKLELISPQNDESFFPTFFQRPPAGLMAGLTIIGCASSSSVFTSL